MIREQPGIWKVLFCLCGLLCLEKHEVAAYKSGQKKRSWEEVRKTACRDKTKCTLNSYNPQKCFFVLKQDKEAEIFAIDVSFEIS